MLTIIKLEKILEGTENQVPKTEEDQITTGKMILNYFYNTEVEKIKDEDLINILNYSMNFQNRPAVLLLCNLLYSDSMKKEMSKYIKDKFVINLKSKEPPTTVKKAWMTWCQKFMNYIYNVDYDYNNWEHQQIIYNQVEV